MRRADSHYERNREALLAKAIARSRARGVQSRRDAKAERAWHVHDAIWRLLAERGPMSAASL